MTIVQDEQIFEVHLVHRIFKNLKVRRLRYLQQKRCDVLFKIFGTLYAKKLLIDAATEIGNTLFTDIQQSRLLGWNEL